MDKRSVAVGTYTIHVRSVGTPTKTTLVLVHGLGVSGDYYLQYADQLSADFDIHILDLPGYGKTPKPKAALTIRQLARVVEQYCILLGLDKPSLVGQSMGAQIVAHAAAQSPMLFRSIILIGPTSNKKERVLPMQAFRLAQDTFREKLKTNRIVFVNYLRMGMFRYLATAKDMVNDHLEVTLLRVPVPVLVVYGSEDPFVPKDWAEKLAAAAPLGSAIAVNGAPHLVQMDKPGELAAITRRFLQ